jgi:hypothetical protein
VKVIAVEHAIKKLVALRTDLLASLTVSRLSSTKKPSRILVADGIELIRLGLIKIINAVSNLIVWAATADCGEVPSLVALRAGAWGYWMKTGTADELLLVGCI